MRAQPISNQSPEQSTLIDIDQNNLVADNQLEQADLSPTNKAPKKKSHKFLKRSFLGLVITVIILIVGYFIGGYHYVDNVLADNIRKETNEFIQNKYIHSVKANVTEADVNKVQKQIYLIHNKKLQQKLLKENKDVLSQALLQTKTMKLINIYYHKANVLQLNNVSVQSLITNAQNIRNQSVKVSVIQKGNIILDRTTKTHNAANTVNELYQNNNLTKSDLGKYYTGVALTKEAYGKSTRTELDKKLKIVKKRLNQKLDADAEAQTNELNSQLNKINNSTFTGGSNKLSVNTLSKADMNGFMVSSSNDNKDTIILNNNSLTIYQMNSGHTNVKSLGNYNIKQKNLSLPDNTTLTNATLVYNTNSQNNGDNNTDNSNNNNGNSNNSNNSGNNNSNQHSNNSNQNQNNNNKPQNQNKQNTNNQNQNNNQQNKQNQPQQNQTQNTPTQNNNNQNTNNQGNQTTTVQTTPTTTDTNNDNTAHADNVALADNIVINQTTVFDSSAPVGNSIRFSDDNGHTVYISNSSNCVDNSILISSSDFNNLISLFSNGLIFSNNK